MIQIIQISYTVGNKTLKQAGSDKLPKTEKDAYRRTKIAEFCKLWGMKPSEVEMHLVYKEL